MTLTPKQIIGLKTKLAIEGPGSKGRLAEKLDLHNSQISLMCETGFVPEHAKTKLKKYLNI